MCRHTLIVRRAYTFAGGWARFINRSASLGQALFGSIARRIAGFLARRIAGFLARRIAGFQAKASPERYLGAVIHTVHGCGTAIVPRRASRTTDSHPKRCWEQYSGVAELIVAVG
jgi:hypothetical protein